VHNNQQDFKELKVIEGLKVPKEDKELKELKVP
jgi:hypothetical protein